jgi:hypothetical protein
MTKVEEQWRFLQHVALLIQKAASLGIVLTGGELYRTQEQQAIYLKEGKSKTANSKHLERLAIDFNFFVKEQLTYDKKTLQPLGDYWEGLDAKNRWGGNFKSILDVPHFERFI